MLFSIFQSNKPRTQVSIVFFFNERSKIFERGLKKLLYPIFQAQSKREQNTHKKRITTGNILVRHTLQMNGVMGVKKACFDWSEVSMKLESYCAPIIFFQLRNFLLRGRSETTFTRGEGQVVKKCLFSKNVYFCQHCKVENVNGGPSVDIRGVGGQKKTKTCQRSL